MTWAECPTDHTRQQVMFVHAATAHDATRIDQDHIARRFGCRHYVVDTPERPVDVPPGRVVDADARAEADTDTALHEELLGKDLTNG